jgi:cell wall-associated NlpC family hydrolase
MRRLPLLLLFVLALAVAAPSGGPPRPEQARPETVAAPAVAHRRERHPRPRPDPFGVRAVRLARHMLGVGYRYGGSSPGSGFDCSGFTSYVYGRLGVELPHNAAAQFGSGRPVPRSRLKPGDLLFFRGLGHVGMYVGRGRMIHAPQSGDVVRVVRLGVDYGGTLVGARRIAPPQPQHAARRLPRTHAV